MLAVKLFIGFALFFIGMNSYTSYSILFTVEGLILINSSILNRPKTSLNHL
jgi:hypothetical protein